MPALTKILFFMSYTCPWLGESPATSIKSSQASVAFQSSGACTCPEMGAGHPWDQGRAAQVSCCFWGTCCAPSEVPAGIAVQSQGFFGCLPFFWAWPWGPWLPRCSVCSYLFSLSLSSSIKTRSAGEPGGCKARGSLLSLLSQLGAGSWWWQNHGDKVTVAGARQRPGDPNSWGFCLLCPFPCPSQALWGFCSQSGVG